MKVLLLSNNWDVAAPVRDFLDERELLIGCSNDLNERYIKADIVVSYCYKHILKPETLARYGGAVNLHNSYLPWGRGSNPLFWAVMNHEPVGVSIHWMDEGLDTGPLIAQQSVMVHNDMTFRQAYEAQHRALSQLFIQHWSHIRNRVGAHHTMEEFNQVKDVLGDEGWDCVISDAKERW